MPAEVDQDWKKEHLPKTIIPDLGNIWVPPAEMYDIKEQRPEVIYIPETPDIIPAQKVPETPRGVYHIEM